MALKAVVTDPASIPEPARPFYVEREGAHYLDVEAVEHGGRKVALEDITGLLNAKNAQQKRADELEARVKAFGDWTPERVKQTAETAERLSKIDPAKLADEAVKEREQSLRQQYETKHKAELEPLTSELEELRAESRERLISAEIHKQLAGVAVPEAIPLLYGFIEKQCDVVKGIDGKRTAVAVDSQGKPRISLKPGNDFMGIDELVAAARATFPSSFTSEAGSGSGSAQHGAANNNNGGGVRRIPRGDQAAINANWQDIASGKAIVV